MQARAELTRAAILRASAELFDRYGYSATSLADIIAHAKVTKGALYFHFGSKQDLAHAVVHEQHTTWVGAAKEYAESALPSLEALIRMSYGLANQLLTNPIVRGGIRLTLEDRTFQQPLPDPYLDWLQIIKHLLERGVGELDVRTGVDLSRVALFLVSSFTGVQLVTQVLGGRADLVGRLGDMWQIVLPGITVPRKLAHYQGVARAASRELAQIQPAQF